MASNAFVLTETAVGRTSEVLKTMKHSGLARTVDAVTGPYDIIATVEGTDQSSIDSAISKIRAMPGVARAVACHSTTSIPVSAAAGR